MSGKPLQKGAWQGRPCWIIGGGPSFDPTDLGKLPKGSLICGTNAAWCLNPTINVTIDARVTEKMLKDPDSAKKCPDTEFLLHNTHERLRKKLEESWLNGRFFILPACRSDPKKLKGRWSKNPLGPLPRSSNTGALALLVCEALGASHIFLFGYDGRVEGEKANWHELHEKNWSANSGKVYGRFGQNLKECKAICEAEIFNLSPDSAYSCFEKITLDEALEL